MSTIQNNLQVSQPRPASPSQTTSPTKTDKTSATGSGQSQTEDPKDVNDEFDSVRQRLDSGLQAKKAAKSIPSNDIQNLQKDKPSSVDKVGPGQSQSGVNVNPQTQSLLPALASNFS